MNFPYQNGHLLPRSNDWPRVWAWYKFHSTRDLALTCIIDTIFRGQNSGKTNQLWTLGWFNMKSSLPGWSANQAAKSANDCHVYSSCIE